MLLTSIIVHVLFFIIGYVSHADPASLQKYSVKDDYFKSGVIFIHLIISILMIVVWLIMMLRNNAFKNFYPTSKGKLFFQFVQYFVILFACTTFYFSYMTGFKMFIKNKYPDTEMNKNIALINKVYPFLAQDISHYTLDNRKYPKIFSDLYCETKINEINRYKKYFVFHNRVYQFYSVYAKNSFQKDSYGNYIVPEPENSNKTPIAYSELKDNSETFYFKKEVVDLSSYIKTIGLTYYNFSDLFYDYNLNDKNYLKDTYYDRINENYNSDLRKKKEFEINKNTVELLNKNNPAELEKLLNEFLKISRQFGIRNNLEAKAWAKMVFSPQNPNFEVRYFTIRYKPGKNEEYLDEEGYAAGVIDSAAAINDEGQIVKDTVSIREFNPEIDSETAPEDFFKNNVTDYYYYTDNLNEVLTNVDYVKSLDFFTENIHVYIWIAFFLATLIFSFRITGLKSLLFSIITAGLLTLGVTLATVVFGFFIRGNEEFFASYLVLIISLIILTIPLFMMKKVSKLVSSILVNISFNGFVPFVFLIFGIISFHQRAACQSKLTEDIYQHCDTIIFDLGLGLSFILLVCGFVFIYFYTSVLQKWKAMPQ